MLHITILTILYFQAMERLIAIPNFIEEQSVFRFICDSKILAKKYSNLKMNKKSYWSLEIMKHRILLHCFFGIIVSGSLIWSYWPFSDLTEVRHRHESRLSHSSFPLNLWLSTTKREDYEPDKLISLSGETSHILQFLRTLCVHFLLKISPNV